MGVFARLFRKSRTTEEAPSTEAEAAQEAAGAEAGATEEARDPATTEAEAKPEGATEEDARATADEGVLIPKQQSAGKTTDSEADEGART
jgi:hypothetical protein